MLMRATALPGSYWPSGSALALALSCAQRGINAATAVTNENSRTRFIDRSLPPHEGNPLAKHQVIKNKTVSTKQLSKGAG
jgi:hypothetical protein